jgi:hypothetical protein
MDEPNPADPIDADGLAAASHRHMREHLTALLQAGSPDTSVTVAPDGTVRVPARTREPLLLAAPGYALEGVSLALTAAHADATVELNFPDGSEAGSYLPLYRPPASLDTQMATAVVLRLRLVEIRPPLRRAVPLDEIDGHLTVRLVQGITGRLLYLLGAEKQRIRQQARLLAGIRTLGAAHGDALDRIGAELAVPRLHDTIAFREPAPEDRASVFGTVTFGTRPFGPGRGIQLISSARREPDDEYRRRLAIYRPWHYPTSRHIGTLLNGPGEQEDRNCGLLAALGVRERVRLTDRPRPFATAVHLVAVGQPHVQPRFHDYLRRTVLVWPGDDATAREVHAGRYVPPTVAERQDALRQRLRAAYEWPADAALAPQLGLALDRLARCRTALSVPSVWQVIRAQDPEGGSRFELGLGVGLRPPDKALLRMLTARLRDGDVALPDEPTADEPDPAETAAVLAAAREYGGLGAEGEGLMRACGLHTMHYTSTDMLYLSHIPTSGLTIVGASSIPPNESTDFEARYYAAGEPSGHALLVRGVAAAEQAWAAAGHDPWLTLRPVVARTAWADAVVTPRPAAAVLERVGLPVIDAPEAVLEPLRRAALDLVATIELPQSVAQRVILGRPEAANALRVALNTLAGQGLSAALVLVLSGDRVLLVVSGAALPVAGANLSGRATARFRWQAIRLWPSGDAADQLPRPGSPEIGSVGTRITFRPPGAGLYAIVAVGHLRHPGAPDAYACNVTFPGDTVLTLPQYEYLMNLLMHVHPLGTRVTTHEIRQRHVDLDGDGVAEAIPPSLSRAYRQYRRPRYRGRTALSPEAMPWGTDSRT